MPNALLVADDLTGAMDTGHGFAASGRGVRVRLDPRGDGSTPGNGDVLAVDTDSRDAAESIAATAVSRAIERFPAALVYEKVDSTLRGNVVGEVDAAVAATGVDFAVVAPAFPAAGRTTEDGRQFVDGTPLADAGYGVDESDLRTIFARSQYPISHVGISVVEAGTDAIGDRIASVLTGDADDDPDPDRYGDDDRERPVLVLCDARTDEHLRAIATGAESLDHDACFVGSGGLANHVTVPGEPRPTAPAVSMRSGVLGVVGSANERTLAQLATLPDEVVVRLDPAAAVRDPEQTGRAALPDLRDRLDRLDRAVVTAATTASDVARAETVASEDGVDAGDRVSRALATAASGTVAASVPSGLVLTGGAVARAVLTTLDAGELALAGDAVVDGVPEGVVITGRAAGTRVVTKAGGFGDERTILNCLDALDRSI